MSRPTGLLTAAAASVAAWPAAAAEAGLPQLNPANFSPQLIWLAITFFVLYVLMARFALPRVAQVLDERRRPHEGTQARADALQAQANPPAPQHQKTDAPNFTLYFLK